MRITLCFVLVSLLSALPVVRLSAAEERSAQGKSVSLRIDSASVEEILSDVSRQTGVDFCIGGELARRRAAIVVHKVSLKTVMDYFGKTKSLVFKLDQGRGCYVVSRSALRVPFPGPEVQDPWSRIFNAPVKKVAMKSDLKKIMEEVSRQTGADFHILDDAERRILRVDFQKATLTDVLKVLSKAGLESARVSGTRTFIIRLAAVGSSGAIDEAPAEDSSPVLIMAKPL